MKAVLYLLAGILVAPGALLACFIWNVKELARETNFFRAIWDIFVRFLESFQILFCLVLPGLALWLVLAFLPSYRWIGALLVAMIAILSIVEMIVASGWPKLDEMFVPFLSLAGLALNLWIVWDSGGGRQIWDRWTK